MKFLLSYSRHQQIQSYYLILFLLASPVSQMAQEHDSIENQLPSEMYIEKFNSNIILKSSINNSVETFEINSDALDFVILPNTNLKTTISVNYRFISFSVGFAPRFLPGNNDNPRKGKSKILSFGFNIQLKKWIQGLSFKQISGFYLDNTSEFIDDWDENSDDYLQFPELKYLAFSGFTGYKFNRAFSLKSISTQTERQCNSAGSFIPVLWYRYYIMDDRTELTGQNSSQKSNTLEMILQLGYYYTFVVKNKFYASAGLSPGGGFIHTGLLTRLPAGDVRTKDTWPIFRAEGLLGLGYNSKRLFAGVQISGRWDRYSQGDNAVITSNRALQYQVFLGYRFKAPQALDRFIDKIPLVK